MGEVILTMKGIDKSFPGVHALDHGFTEQEFVGEELEDLEPEEEPDDSDLEGIEFDEYSGYDEN